MARAFVVFDFDGTIALGQGPLDAYARCVGALTSPDIADSCAAAVDEFNTGSSPYLDAYAAVREAAIARGVDDETLSKAYLDSRELLATEAAPISAPHGLTTFFTTLAAVATPIIATNAPTTGLVRALDSLGIAGIAAQVHSSVGKPAGLVPIVTDLVAAAPTLAVGDIWENDLAPAAELGAATAYVGVGEPAGRPTMSAATLTDLYDDILGWVSHRLPASDGSRTRTIDEDPSSVSISHDSTSTTNIDNAYAER